METGSAPVSYLHPSLFYLQTSTALSPSIVQLCYKKEGKRRIPGTLHPSMPVKVEDCRDTFILKENVAHNFHINFTHIKPSVLTCADTIQSALYL